mmetsp:Transcript_22939/g.32830  ORF Transcript_22939/g.32830 Transcript_22939/m.32830 type:complete len:90 (+) Transcript_22939:1103-1372(+)
MAYLGLRGHYLGINNVDNMATSVETTLQSTYYTGEKRRFNFEDYVQVHMDQHSFLEGLVDHGYAGIDERSKVRLLMDGIRTHEYDAVKT